VTDTADAIDGNSVIWVAGHSVRPGQFNSGVSMPNSLEILRRQRLHEINVDAADRATLERRHGPVWDTSELARDYEVVGFLTPFAVARRRNDGTLGSLEFQAVPRCYFNFVPHHPSPSGDTTA